MKSNEFELWIALLITQNFFTEQSSREFYSFTSIAQFSQDTWEGPERVLKNIIKGHVN